MHAVQCVRRFAEIGEAADRQVLMILLDWEQALDKVTRESLWNAMNRMNVHPKLIKAVQSIYRATQLKVEMGGAESAWYEQQAGIRQGCPSSPYLFLLVMTALFHDVQNNVDRQLGPHRLPGVNFDA
eukprot:6373446-Pyramimonas_sp.AAC.1